MEGVRIGSAFIEVTADSHHALQGIESEASESGNRAGSMFGSNFGAKMVAGLAALGVGAAIGSIFKTGLDEAKDASEGQAQLEAGLKSTGNAANTTVDDMEELASSIQGYSGQTDDSIVKSEQLLLTFTNIRNNGPDKIFDLATQASADMAAKMGGDASSNAIILGKALNDPVAGISALTRVGVTFSQGQKDAIDAMVKTGDVAGAQKVILGELSTEFGGAAQAAGDSLPGQLAKGKRAFEDMSQSVVTAILPVVLPAIQNIAAGIKDAMPAIVEFAKGFSEKLKDALDVVGPPLLEFGKFLLDHKEILLGFAVGITAIVGGFKLYAETVKIVTAVTEAWKVAQMLLNGEMVLNPIGLIVVGLAALVAGIVWVATQTTFFQDAWKVMSQAVGAVWSWLWNTVLKPVFDFIGSAINVIGIAAMGLWTNFIQPAVQAIGNIFNWLWNSIINPIVILVELAFVLLGMGVSALWNAFIQPSINAIGAIFQWLWNSVISPVGQWIGNTINAVGAIISSLWSAYVQPAINAIGDVFNWLWNSVISPVGQWIGDSINNLGGIVGGVFNSMADTMKNAFNGVEGIVKGVINSVIDAVNGGIGGINSLIDTANSVPGVSLPHLGTIPHLATGGTISGDGIALVGENGPEIVSLPTGATVYPTGTGPSSDLAGGGNGGTTIHSIHVTIDAKNVKDFNSVVDIMNNIGQTARTGRGTVQARIA